MEQKANYYKQNITISILSTFAKSAILLLLVTLVGLVSFSNRFSKPKVWAKNEVPITFWAWQRTNPDQQNVNDALKQVKSNTLFLHSGQIDYITKDNSIRLIRQPEGSLPKGVALHLVYNATIDLLGNFEKIDPIQLAETISEYYKIDLYKANKNNSQVIGIQLDIDVPTRLLPKYTELLKLLSLKLPPNTALSITGLPTWMNSRDLKETLATVDFWVPQFYGANIPKKINKLTPISNPQTVAQGVEKARLLDYPFYAGLSAYGYAIRYDSSGNFMQIRGDIDPIKIINNNNLIPIKTPLISDNKLIATEQIYLYQAVQSFVLDGLVVRKNDYLMLELPTPSVLQENMKIVRENAGARLLGICIFRLPTNNDTTNLTLTEITRAVREDKVKFRTDLYLEQVNRGNSKTLFLTLKNNSNETLITRNYEITVDIKIASKNISSVMLDGFISKDYFCESNTYENRFYSPCSPNRADILRLKASYLRPNQELQAFIELTTDLADSIPANISITSDSGNIWQDKGLFPITKR